MDTCRVDNCTRPIHLKRDRLCNAHYLQQRKGKPFTEPRKTVPHGSKDCSFEGCDKPMSARTYCTSHYWMFMRGRKMVPLYSTMRPRGSVVLRDANGNKECTYCGVWRPESDFGPNAKHPDGLRSQCTPCRRQHYMDNRDDFIARRIKAFFNITIEDRDEMLVEQGGVCACCGTEEPGSKGWTIDHDHACCPESGRSCGKCVRGILCMRCNLTLGSVQDNTEILRSMIGYLSKEAA